MIPATGEKDSLRLTDSLGALFDAPAVLADLQRRGFEVSAEGDGIRISPASQLSDADRQAVRLHKPDLLALLAGAPVAAPPADSVPAACPTDPPAEVAVYLPCSCPDGICWPCCNRPCEVCRRPTGSAFIALCMTCEQLPNVA